MQEQARSATAIDLADTSLPIGASLALRNDERQVSELSGREAPALWHAFNSGTAPAMH